MLKYKRHHSLPTESPLAKASIQEETPANNGDLSGIALCSSRSRAQRNSGSFSRLSRKNSQEKEKSASPKQRRSGVVDNRDSLTEDGGSIVLDPSSILDEIMAVTFKDSEEEKSPPPPTTRRGLSNGITDTSSSSLNEQKTTDKEDTMSSRQRSVAMDTSSSQGLRSKAKLVSQRAGSQEMSNLIVPPPSDHHHIRSDVTEMKASDRKSEIRRSGSINKGDDYRRSGGNWNKLRGQISGGKALGMFYHNRRSQYLDDSLEVAQNIETGPNLERNDASHPISPLVKTSSESEEIRQKALSSGSTNDTEVRERGGGSLFYSTAHMQSSEEPSALQQALQAKKQAQSRVAQRAKKMYAMMEDEVIIGDPAGPRGVGQLSRNQLQGGNMAAEDEIETQGEPTGETLMDEQRPGLEWAYAPTDIPLG